MPIIKPDYQLKLDLELDDPATSSNSENGEGGIIPEEARLRSETARLALEGVDVTWKGEYEKLVQGGWNWRVAAYIAWAACPEGRIPKTQSELAKQHLGLTSDRAISTWRKKNPAINEMVAILQAAPLWNHRAEIYEALIAVATSKEYKGYNDRKLALELMGDYVPQSKLEAELNQKIANDLTNLPFEEKLKLAGLDSAEKLNTFLKKLKNGEVDTDEDGEDGKE